MSSHVNRVALRVLGIEMLASLIVFLIVLAIRWLLVLEAKAADASTQMLGAAIVLAAVVAPARSLVALRRYRFPNPAVAEVNQELPGPRRLL